MPIFDIPKDYQDDSDLTEAMLDSAFEYIETALNTTKLDSSNIQTGGISSDNIAAAAVVEAKLGASAVTTNKLGDATVTTPKIADLNVTLEKLAAAVQAALSPAGTVAAYAGTAAPAGWLLCNGNPVSRTTYADLYAVVGTAFGDGTKNADGTSSGYGVGTYFNLPDLRGRFMRFVDGTAGNDPDKASRTAMLTGGNAGNNVGSVQDDAFKSHTHGIPNSSAGSTLGLTNSGTGLGGTDTAATGGSETRPKNIYFNGIIKT